MKKTTQSFLDSVIILTKPRNIWNVFLTETFTEGYIIVCMYINSQIERNKKDVNDVADEQFYSFQ